MHNKSIRDLSSGLQKGEFSSVELAQHFLERIKTLDPDLNSFITVTQDRAIEQATAADAKIAAGNAGPLTGIPIAQKDIFCTEGVKSSCGSFMLDNFISPYDANVISKMHDDASLGGAGAVMLGKTNMDEFAMGSSNETSYYGAVKNPWDKTKVPGGSSGGSASAVAARLCVAATGTDTGGSIRQPAAFCGITGLKPTYGTVSRYGMIAFASSLDQAGPMASSAEDAAIILSSMVGFDKRDSTSLDRPAEDYTKDLNNDIKGLKIGLVKEFFTDSLDGQIAASLEQAIEEIKKLGAEPVEISLPNINLSVPAYYVVAPAECSSNLSRFDGVRYGHRCEDPTNLEDLYKRSRAEGFGPEVKRRIMIGAYALSAGYYDAYYLKAQKIRRLISEDFKKAFEQVDVLVSPSTPGTAFGIGEKTDDPIEMYLSDIYTIGVNLAGLPGMSLPVGQVGNLPVGLQLVGDYFSEAKLLNVAHQLQLATDWHKLRPVGGE